MTLKPQALLLLSLCVAPSVTAQVAGPTQRPSGPAAVVGSIASLSIDTVDVRHYPLVRMIFHARDQAGQPVLGLAAREVMVTADSATISLDSLRPILPPGQGVEVVVVLDISGSVRQALPEIRAGLISLAERLGPTVPIGVVTAGTAAQWALRPATDRAVLDSIVAALRAAAPSTALWDAVALAAAPDSAARSTSSRRVIVLSDGDDNSSGQRVETVAAAIGGAGTQVHALLVGQRVTRTGLARLVAASGGSLQRADRDGVRRALIALGVDLATSYEAFLKVDAPAGIWDSLTIQLREAAQLQARSRPLMFHGAPTGATTRSDALPLGGMLLGWAVGGAAIAVAVISALFAPRAWRWRVLVPAAGLGATLMVLLRLLWSGWA